MMMPIKGGVAVVADNTWRAVQAANAIEIKWGDAPYPAEMDGHWQALSDSFNDDQQDSSQRDDGDDGCGGVAPRMAATSSWLLAS